MGKQPPRNLPCPTNEEEMPLSLLRCAWLSGDQDTDEWEGRGPCSEGTPCDSPQPPPLSAPGPGQCSLSLGLLLQLYDGSNVTASSSSPPEQSLVLSPFHM